MSDYADAQARLERAIERLERLIGMIVVASEREAESAGETLDAEDAPDELRQIVNAYKARRKAKR